MNDLSNIKIKKIHKIIIHSLTEDDRVMTIEYPNIVQMSIEQERFDYTTKTELKFISEMSPDIKSEPLLYILDINPEEFENILVE